MLRISILAVSSLFLIVAGCKRATPRIIEVDEGFHGRIILAYDVVGAPPLVRVDAREVIRVPANGIVRTSTRNTDGVVDDVVLSTHRGAVVRLIMDTPGPNPLPAGHFCLGDVGEMERPHFTWDELVVGPGPCEHDAPTDDEAQWIASGARAAL